MEYELYKNELYKKIAFSKTIKASFPEYAYYDFQSKKIVDFLNRKNIKLFSHQVLAIENILKGKDVVITTPTASGKSLIYILSFLEKLEKNPGKTAILVFPLVALARDQKNKIENLIREIGIKASVETYYGDTPKNKRMKIRKKPPNFLITTPDMLNVGILPYHHLWENFFRNLDMVVIDEVHVYRGVLGSHVANIIMRLNRISKLYTGEKPQYVCNSATVKNPIKFVSKFIEKEDLIEVSKSGTTSPEKDIYITEPISSKSLVSFIIQQLLNDISTILFIDSRKDLEILYLNVKKELKKKGLYNLVDKVKPYRSGYKQEEREAIEKGLANGDIKVVLSTSALEMGIDIGEIDCVVLKGFPGTLSAMWQRFGRAGRRNKKAYNYLITKLNALDQYYLKNPEEIFNRQVEEPIINPQNKYILKKHLFIAAIEKPIEFKEIDEIKKDVIKELLEENKLYFINGKFYPKKNVKPFFSIRSAGDTYDIIDIKKNEIIGNINQEYAFYEAFKDAIYIHLGNTYIVLDRDDIDKKIYAEERNINYYTTPVLETEVEILDILKLRKYKDIEIYYGEVNVKSTIVGYSSIEIETNQRIKDKIFDEFYQRNFSTKAFWFKIPDYYEKLIKKYCKEKRFEKILNIVRKKLDYTYYEVAESIIKSNKNFIEKFKILFNPANPNLKDKIDQKSLDFLQIHISKLEDDNIFIGSLHAVEHGMIGIYSIFAMNDRWDIGGMSTNFHYQTKSPTIFIYDGYEGGIGYSEVGFNNLESILMATYKNIKNCKCINGCPSCILSPKCGNANDHLDKLGSEVLLELLIQ